MNTLFNTISWTGYAGLLALVITFYYLFIGLRCYRSEIINLLRTGSFKPAQKVQTNPFLALEQKTTHTSEKSHDIYQHLEGTGEASPEAGSLIAALRAEISELSEQPYQPAAVPPKLKAIIAKYPDLKNSPDRAYIDKTIVAECEKTGIALLTEDEVDQWWSD